MNQARAWHSSCILKQKLFVFAGFDADKGHLSSIEWRNLESLFADWITFNNSALEWPMSESSVCAISETKIVIMGGRNFQNYLGSTVKILNIKAGALETAIESTGHSFMSLGQTIAEEDGKVLSFVLAGENETGMTKKNWRLSATRLKVTNLPSCRSSPNKS